MQFEAANRGNVVMQIWLGKNYLGQSDHRTEVHVTPENMGPSELANLFISMHSERRKEFLDETLRVLKADYVASGGKRDLTLLALPEDDNPQFRS